MLGLEETGYAMVGSGSMREEHSGTGWRVRSSGSNGSSVNVLNCVYLKSIC